MSFCGSSRTSRGGGGDTGAGTGAAVSRHACLYETEHHLHQDVNTRQITQLNATLITLYVFASVATDGYADGEHANGWTTAWRIYEMLTNNILIWPRRRSNWFLIAL